jgi:hypothetical protein
MIAIASMLRTDLGCDADDVVFGHFEGKLALISVSKEKSTQTVIQ